MNSWLLEMPRKRPRLGLKIDAWSMMFWPCLPAQLGAPPVTLLSQRGAPSPSPPWPVPVSGHPLKDTQCRGSGSGVGRGGGRRPAEVPPPRPFPRCALSLAHLPSSLHLGALVYLSRATSHATSPGHLPASRHSWNPNSVPWAPRHSDLCHDVPHWPGHPRMVIFELLVLTQGLTLGQGREEPVQE